MEQAAQETTGRAEAGAAQSGEEALSLSAGQYLDKALNLIGKKMRNAASLVRERAPREGASRNALESVSDVLDSTGTYMMRQNVSEDVGGVVRQYPLRSLGVCFVAGFVVGTVARLVRRQRYV
jgi:hypothetical protein